MILFLSGLLQQLIRTIRLQTFKIIPTNIQKFEYYYPAWPWQHYVIKVQDILSQYYMG